MLAETETGTPEPDAPDPDTPAPDDGDDTEE